MTIDGEVSAELIMRIWVNKGDGCNNTNLPFHLEGSWWSLFFGMQKTLFIEYLQKGPTINGECYIDFLRELRKAIIWYSLL